MKSQISLRVGWLLLLIIATNLVMIFGTWLLHYTFYSTLGGDWSQASKLEYAILQFSLASENTIATWYSSKLFFLVALVSFFCFLIQKEKENKNYLSYGWLIFFAIFTVLSYDEIASMHERIGNIAALNPFGDGPPGWIILLTIPIVVVGGFMLWFCWIQAKKAPYAVVFAAIGILLFLTIPLQELFETEAWLNSSNPASWMRPVHFLLLEEGSELFGATFMFISIILFARSANGTTAVLKFSDKLEFAFHLKKNIFFKISTAILLLLGLLMILLENSDLLEAEGEMGVSRNWFPSVTAFLAAILSLFIFYKRKKTGFLDQSVYFYLAIFCLFLSCYYGSYIYVYLWKIEGGLIQTSFLIFSRIITLVLGIALFINTRGYLKKIGVVMWTIIILIALGFYNDYAAFLAYTAFSFLLLTQFNMILSKKIVLNESRRLSSQ